MQWTSIAAIFLLFFVMSAFVLLPFGVKTADEAGIEKVPGQAESAPAHFSLPKHILRAAIMGSILTALYVANYIHGWIGVDDINIFGTPPGFEE